MRNVKELLTEDNHKKFNDFLLSQEEELELLAPSFMPGIAVSSKRDIFKKEVIIGCEDTPQRCVNFIKKNGKPHSITWQSTASQIQQGVRWGIIKPQSVSGKVIAALGQYRITAHERVFKGMISNTQTLKIKLLDHYQSRFELLQELESLVNKNNEYADYETAFNKYCEALKEIQQNIESEFQGDENNIDPKLVSQLQQDIKNDLERAKNYLNKIEKKSIKKQTLRSYNRARGHQSVLEFVKQQMTHNLYELQGINQDITYSRKRRFALTRGALNDFIEDARKEIDDYGADSRNAVTAQHHGRFAPKDETLVTYDFSKNHLSSKQERDTLLAISFIEGWDKVTRNEVESRNQAHSLTTIYATNWKKHRNITALFKNLGYYVLNVIKGIFLPTTPWREEAWDKKDFHLQAWSLMAHAKQREPLWLKPFKVFKSIGQAVIDIFRGVSDFGKNLIVRMPADLFNDWAATNDPGELTEVLKTVGEEIEQIKHADKNKLNQLFQRTKWSSEKQSNLSNEKSDLNEMIESESEHAMFQKPVLGQMPYSLHFGEQNDILNAIVRGVDGFSTVFTHNIFAKDPVAGLVFTAAYAAGGAVIFFPAFSQSLFGSMYVNWFSSFSYSMGSSKIAATIAGGSTQAQIFASTWDLLTHGPSSVTANTVSELIEDPVTAGTAFMVAYGLGYILANGIAGHEIPWLSHVLKEDLGSRPEVGYPLIGAKVAISLYEALIPGHNEDYKQVSLSCNGTEFDEQEIQSKQQLFLHKNTVEKFFLAHWLNKNTDHLPQLKRASQAIIARHIEKIFPAEEADALKKLVYPEKSRSIAFQLFAIPLSYVPALLRVLLAVLLSLVAFVKEKPHPWEPIKRSFSALGKKLATDLNRLLMLVSNVVNFAFKMIAIFVKMTMFVLNMLIGRIASLLFGQATAHAIHRIFAAVHVFFRNVGEFLYPARAAKSVEVAHPAHVIQTTQNSYLKMLQNFKVDINKEDQKESRILNPVELENQTDRFSNVFSIKEDTPFSTSTYNFTYNSKLLENI